RACDSCKKKKVRCDPSHRSPAEAVSSTQRTSRNAKRQITTMGDKFPAIEALPSETTVLGTTSPFVATPTAFEPNFFDPAAALSTTAPFTPDEWDEFLRSEGELGAVLPDNFSE